MRTDLGTGLPPAVVPGDAAGARTPVRLENSQGPLSWLPGCRGAPTGVAGSTLRRGGARSGPPSVVGVGTRPSRWPGGGTRWCGEDLFRAFSPSLPRGTRQTEGLYPR